MDHELELESYGRVLAQWSAGWEGQGVECRAEGVCGYAFGDGEGALGGEVAAEGEREE